MKKFGRWTVVSDETVKWLCRCDCGTERHVAASDLRAGKSKSCGCLAREVTSRVAKTWTYKHGMDGTTEYRIWIDMRRRCHQPQRPDYKRYGAVGILVCERWRSSFENFFADMGKRPSKNHTLDRVNNDGDYTPENCRWATRKEQERNKTTNRIVEIRGERMTVVEASERFSVPAMTIFGRLRRGFSDEHAVFSTKPMLD